MNDKSYRKNGNYGTTWFNKGDQCKCLQVKPCKATGGKCQKAEGTLSKGSESAQGNWKPETGDYKLCLWLAVEFNYHEVCNSSILSHQDVEILYSRFITILIPAIL